jgi:hypothetical protein
MNSISTNNESYSLTRLSNVTKGILAVGTTAGLYYFATDREIAVKDIIPYTIATGAVTGAIATVGGIATTVSSLLLSAVTDTPIKLIHTAAVGAIVTVGGIATTLVSIECGFAYLGYSAISAFKR